MRLKHFYKIVLLLIVTGFSVSCSKNGDLAPQLTVSVKTVSFEPEGGTLDSITIVANSKWSINNPASSWLQLTQTNGNGGTTVITLTALSNDTKFSRSVTLNVAADNGQARIITVTQLGKLYPSYNLTPIAPDSTGMSSNAVQLAAKMQMGMGINFGNTMESPQEADWQNSKLTESYVKYVKSLGFNSVRLPCNWVWTHLSDRSKAKIDPAWLARVKEVVGWCVANDMYVILNSHDSPNANAIKQDSVNAMQKAIWQQIATEMRDFDEHLIFAGLNEPPVEDAQQMAILNGYHETFIKAVRSTGGRNSYRVLLVQAPTTDANKAATLMKTLPTDKVPNKLMVELHDYTPSLFTIVTDGDVSWGKMIYYWGAGNHSTIEPDRNATFGEEDVVISEFQKSKERFIDNGIPVILGEYGLWRRNAIHNSNYLPLDMEKHNQSVNYWTKYVTKQAKEHGLMPFWWETGFMLDRKNNAILDQPMYDALVEAYK